MADKKEKEKDKKEKDKDKDVKEEKPAGEGAEGAEGEAGAEGGKKKPPLKLIIIIAVAVVVLLGGGVAALFMTGVIGGKPKTEAAAEGAEAPAAGGHEAPAAEEGHGKKKEGDKKGGSVFYDLGEIVVNLQAEGRRQTFLKLVVQLELENEADKPTIENLKPRIVDNFQTYLRELRMDDLRGSAGLYRLREELLFRVTEAAYPVKVKDVLFQQMLVQ